MDKNNHPINKLRKQVEKYGLKMLLPQNIPNDAFQGLVEEVQAFLEGRVDETSSSVLFMSILYLKNGSKISDNMRIEFSEEELFDYYDMYAVSVRLEDMRRKGSVFISDDSLPTLKNIFDKNRNVEIRGLDE